MKKFIITWAQNATPVNGAFFASLLHYAEINKAELLVIPGRYRNPTSQWTEKQAKNEWWDSLLDPYLMGRMAVAKDEDGVAIKSKDGKRKLRRMEPGVKKLCKGLTVHGDISIQPTAVRPLSQLEVYTAENSAVFGHPKRALEVVPTGTRTPRVMWTTTSCTVPNYTKSKAGKRGKAHHVLGALVVEVDGDKYWCRHITADWRTGEFTDLATVYGPAGSREAPQALSLTLGDYHAGREDEAVLAATERLCTLVRPRHLVLHDVLDFYTRNHHEKSLRAKFDRHHLFVEREIDKAAEALNRVAGWSVGKVHVVRSNHDEHLERWLEECKPHEDPRNARYYYQLWARAFDARFEKGSFPDLFAMEMRRLKVNRKVRFLTRNQSLRIGNVEGGFHGDKGNGGSRGSDLSYTKLGVRVTKGHSHTPRIIDNVFSAGVKAVLDHGYNTLPTTWMNADVLQYADGKRTVIIFVDGRFSGGDGQ